MLLALVGVFSLTSPLTMSGIRALLPRLVPVTALARVNALDTSIHGLSDIAGPALAGAIVGFGGPALALGIIALTYAAAALCVGTIRRPRGRLPRLGPLLAEAWGGVLRVVRHPSLRGLAVSYSLYEVSWGILVVVVPVFAARQFAGGTGAAVAGLLWAGLGLVGGIAALIAGHRRIAGREREVMALGMLVTAVAAWPIAAEFGLAGLAFGLMLVGAAAGPIDVGVLTLRQRRTDPAELGRVLSVSMSLNMAGGPLGSALAGLLVTWSLSAAFAVAALACGACGRRRRVDPWAGRPLMSRRSVALCQRVAGQLLQHAQRRTLRMRHRRDWQMEGLFQCAMPGERRVQHLIGEAEPRGAGGKRQVRSRRT